MDEHSVHVPTPTMDEFDWILSQTSSSELFAMDPSNQTPPRHPSTPQPSAHAPLFNSGTSSTLSVATSSTRFVLMSDSDLRAVKENAVPKNTARNTTWAVKVWKDWSAHRQQSFPGVFSEWPVHLYIANDHILDYWLSKFVIEVRNSCGNVYPPNTLYSVCCGLQRYIKDHRPQINIFKDACFSGFIKTLDSEMKRLRSVGLGVTRKQAEPLTVDEENSLWEQGLLGDSTPQTLIDSLLFLCGINFALRSGQEHRSLQVTQIELVVPPNVAPYVIYTENYSKNNAGGLSHRKVKPKQVVHHANEENPERCLVQLYKKYLEHRPQTTNTALYLRPLKKPKDSIWFSKLSIGHNTLSNTVARVCKAGGINGYKTNHSLRVTTATRLFQRGVDEQLIMSRTGHRSIEGVRTYKRVSEEQTKGLSYVLNDATNGAPATKKCKSVVPALQPTCTTSIANTNHSSADSDISQASVTNSLIPSTFHFSGCSHITFNINNKS